MDLRSLDLNLLVSLDALLAERNVTRAAARLHVSQPALSAQLARLRAIFDDPLLMPAESGRGMVATARAERLQTELRGALHHLQMVISRAPSFDPHNDVRSFTLASSDNASMLIGLPLFEALRTAAGDGIRIAWRSVDGARVAAQLESGEIDFLIAAPDVMPPAMKATRVIQERFVMAQRKGHPRGTGPLDLSSYCALRHVLVSISGGNFHGFMDEHLERLGARRTVAVSVQQFGLAAAILQVTDYVCTLPARLMQRYTDTLDAFELPFAAQGFSLYLGWHPRFHADPAHSWLRDMILRCVR
ncbi:LysR family transcriptional regulator [Pandoraea sp.]|uniref:LysR family transcriptional regulator n=1 Tax=Pandoraea sp. TaxID=1883445 RepID=UPI0012020C39|nr:LysR family transcriptional regulator [Pandoraea sp.]TAL57233.1 MAG: LysR family transcriptional regulator [Pandoraea sp.]TAM16519.1 MAG: LysR family transcriptional regulator [Pandoraea sp.]